MEEQYNQLDKYHLDILFYLDRMLQNIESRQDSCQNCKLYHSHCKFLKFEDPKSIQKMADRNLNHRLNIHLLQFPGRYIEMLLHHNIQHSLLTDLLLEGCSIRLLMVNILSHNK